MSAIITIAKRELSSYLSSPLGYIVLAAVLCLHAIWFLVLIMREELTAFTAMENFFFHSTGWVAVFAVAISMRLFAEETQTGTLLFLQTRPLPEWQLVAGKYLGGMWFLLLYLTFSSLIPMSIFLTGEISFGHVVVGYTGLLLLGAAVLAVGTFTSTLASHQLLALVLSIVLVAALFLCWFIAKKVDGTLGDVIGYLDLMDRHFRSFSRGVFKLSSAIYYLSLAYAALLSATAVLVARRWK